MKGSVRHAKQRRNHEGTKERFDVQMSKLTEAVAAVARVIIREKQFLTDLDAKIGDNDHGINMARGFEAVREYIDEVKDPNDPSEVLQAVGSALIENVGGAAGPLYGAGFLAAGKALTKDDTFTIETMERALGAAVAAIKKRGRSQKGDKTMLDVLIPVYECFTPRYAKDLTLYECLTEANYAATDGVEYTKTIAARKGRASYLGERSIGYQDPGATSAMLMYRAMYQFLNQSTIR